MADGAQSQGGEFEDVAAENQRIWDANAGWWDDRIGDGNDFQEKLIEPATERLLAVRADERILDVACGAGRFSRRLAELGARVVAFDHSERFIERARQRAKTDRIDYRVLDAADEAALRSLGEAAFDKAVCSMGLMDMPRIAPLFGALARALKPAGRFVFSVIHPCFHSAVMQRFAEMHEDGPGRQVFRVGVKVSGYKTPVAYKTEGIIGQPLAQFCFHRPLEVLLAAGLAAGFAVDGLEEPSFKGVSTPQRGLRWDDMPEIPPVMVVRMTRAAK